MNPNFLEKDVLQVTDNLDKALELSQNKFGKRVVSIDPPKFDIREDFTVKAPDEMDLGDESLRISRGGLVSLCNATSPRIPYDPFALNIPGNLLRQNVHDLIRRSESLRLVIRKEEPVIVGFMTDGTDSLSDEGVLNVVVRNLLEKQEGNELKVSFTDQELKASIIQELTVAPIVGDITKLGQVLFHSSVGNFATHGRICTYRLVCSNGAIMPKTMGSFRTKFGFGGDPETGLIALNRKAAALNSARTGIALRYKLMVDTRCNELLWSRTWGAVKRIVDEADEADEILQTDDETRKAIRSYVKEATRDPVNAESQRLVNSTVYEVFNHVSAAGNDYPEDYKKGLKLQVLAGKFLDHVVKMPSLAA